MLKKQKSNKIFFLDAITACIAVLLIIFSSHRSAASIELSKEKQTGFSSLIGINDDPSVVNSPVTAPSPAVFANKSHASKINFASKILFPVLQINGFRHFPLSQSGASILKMQPLRLHLALRVLRI